MTSAAADPILDLAFAPGPELDLLEPDDAPVEWPGAWAGEWLADEAGGAGGPDIPLGGDPRVATDGWNLAAAPRRGSPSGWLRAVAVAGSMGSLLLATTTVQAAPPTTGAPDPAPDSAPDSATDPTAAPPTSETPPTPSFDPTQPSVAASTAEAVGPARIDPSAVWLGLIDRAVVLSLAGGASLRGVVLSYANGALVFAREVDGLVVLVEVAEVTAVHVSDASKGQPAKPPQTGTGAIVFGSIATAIGGALGVATLAVAATCSDGYSGYLCPYYTLPLGVSSVINLGVGIPILAAGLAKRKRYRAQLADQALPPVQLSGFAGPTRTGAMAGVGIRF